MRRSIIIIIIIFLMIIIIGVILYFYYEKPTSENAIINYTSLSITAKDIRYIEKVSNYTISLNNIENIYKQGTTLIGGYVLERVPENSTIYVFNSGGNNTYYTDLHIINSYESDPFRIDLMLIEPGNLSFSHIGELGLNKTIFVKAESNGAYNDVRLCIKWSKHIVKVDIGPSNDSHNTTFNDTTFNIVDKTIKYQNTDKCYSSGVSMDSGDILEIPLDYQSFGEIDSADYIELILFDNDDYIKDWDNEQIYKITM